MINYRSANDFATEFFQSSLLDVYSEIYEKTGEIQYDEKELNDFLDVFYKTENNQKKAKLLCEADDLLTTRPSTPLSESQIPFINELFELMQTKINFYQTLHIFLYFVVCNENIGLDDILTQGLANFLFDTLSQSLEDDSLSLEESSCILKILTMIAKRANNYKLGILSIISENFGVLYGIGMKDDYRADITSLLLVLADVEDKNSLFIDQITNLSIDLLKLELPPESLNFSDEKDENMISSISQPSEINNLLLILIKCSEKATNFFEIITKIEISRIINFILQKEYYSDTLNYTLLLLIKILKLSENFTEEKKDEMGLFQPISKPIKKLPFDFENIPKLIHPTTPNSEKMSFKIPCFATKIMSLIMKLGIETRIRREVNFERVIPSFVELLEEGMIIQRIYALKAFRTYFVYGDDEYKDFIFSLELSQYIFDCFDSDDEKLIIEALKMLITILDYGNESDERTIESVTKYLDETLEDLIDEFIDSANSEISEKAEYIKSLILEYKTE